MKRKLYEIEYGFGSAIETSGYIVAESFDAALATFRAQRPSARIAHVKAVKPLLLVFVEGDA